ncbi:hypothetical protein GQ42DRAFT_164505 [Ramicandelaber brevisporus]|nr:hypothetical protein GQ42DRAFT_164505 [Ramicandelaber brevisporus]
MLFWAAHNGSVKLLVPTAAMLPVCSPNTNDIGHTDIHNLGHCATAAPSLVLSYPPPTLRGMIKIYNQIRLC